jgi:radical SAM protein with 4Fe4S-binding SPASM domain
MDSIMLERGNNRDVPKWIVLQLLEACNLRCRMCYEWGDGGSYIGKKKLDTLSLQKVKEVIDECETAHPYYELFGGEPLLYPDIFEVIEYIHQKGSKVDMATNGTLLEKNEEALACSGISRIWVSIDGDEETNDLQRGAGVFKKAVSGIQKIKDIRRDKKPKVGITTIVTPKNANVLAKNFFEFAANCPIDHISIEFQNYATSKEYEEYKVFLKNNFGIGEAEAAKGYVRDTEEFAGIDCGTLSEDMVRIKQYCAEHDIKMFHNPNVISKENYRCYFSADWEGMRGIRKRCPFVWLHAEVTASGDVITCHTFHDLTFGNVYKNHFLDIWNNEKCRRYKNLLRAGKMPMCVACSRNYSQLGGHSY